MWRIKVGYNTALNGAGPSLSRLTATHGLAASPATDLRSVCKHDPHTTAAANAFLISLKSTNYLDICVIGRATNVQIRFYASERESDAVMALATCKCVKLITY